MLSFCSNLVHSVIHGKADRIPTDNMPPKRSGNYTDLASGPWANDEAFISILRKHASPSLDALELGCGKGLITSHAAWLFHHLYATDPSRRMLRDCRLSCPYDNVSFHRLHSDQLTGFAESSVGFIYSFDFLGRSSPLRIYSYLKEISRVLRSGCVALVSIEGFLPSFEEFKRISLTFSPRDQRDGIEAIHLITEEVLMHMLQDLNFDILEIDRSNRLIVTISKR